MKNKSPLRFLTLLLLCSLALPVFAQTDEKELLHQIRENLPSAFREQAACNRIFNEYKNVKTTDPVLKGYIGGLYIARSKHVPIIDKPASLRTGTGMLEDAIKERPNNIELLFLRLTIQINLPGFLGYNDNIEGDKKFVIEHYNTAPPVLRGRIVNFVKESDAFTTTEKARVN